MTAIQISYQQAAQLISTLKADTSMLPVCVRRSCTAAVHAVQALLKQAIHKQPFSHPDAQVKSSICSDRVQESWLQMAAVPAV